MGFWDMGPFDNDAAGDWTDQFEEGAAESVVEAQLESIVAAADQDYLDLDDCCAGVAAAAMVAAGRGHASRGMPDHVALWIAEKDYRPGDEVALLAQCALRRIRAQSELADLARWDWRWRWTIGRLISRVGRRSRDAGRLRAERQRLLDKEAASPIPKAIKKNVWGPKGQPPDTLYAYLHDFTDEQLRLASEFPTIERADLRRTKITDAGMPYLATMPNLWDLNLADTAITEESLKQLERIANLHRVNLYRCDNLSPEAKETFKRRPCFSKEAVNRHIEKLYGRKP